MVKRKFVNKRTQMNGFVQKNKIDMYWSIFDIFRCLNIKSSCKQICSVKIVDQFSEMHTTFSKRTFVN